LELLPDPVLLKLELLEFPEPDFQLPPELLPVLPELELFPELPELPLRLELVLFLLFLSMDAHLIK